MLSMDYLPHAPSAVFSSGDGVLLPRPSVPGMPFTRTLLREDEPRFPAVPSGAGGPADLFVTMQNGKRIRINQQVKRLVSAPARFSPFSVTAALFIGQLIVKPPPQPVGKVDIVGPGVSRHRALFTRSLTHPSEPATARHRHWLWHGGHFCRYYPGRYG